VACLIVGCAARASAPSVQTGAYRGHTIEDQPEEQLNLSKEGAGGNE